MKKNILLIALLMTGCFQQGDPVNYPLPSALPIAYVNEPYQADVYICNDFCDLNSLSVTIDSDDITWVTPNTEDNESFIFRLKGTPTQTHTIQVNAKGVFSYGLFRLKKQEFDEKYKIKVRGERTK